MCNAPSMSHGARPAKEVEDLSKKVTGLNGVALDQLTVRGQRQIGLASRAQFGQIAGVSIGPPKDISRQTDGR